MYTNNDYTLELRHLLRMKDEQGQPFKLWDFEYPSYYKGEQKTAFEQKVIEHYYFHQIGQETPMRFKHYLKTKMNEVMPYFIQLYESVQLMQSIEDPFGNVDVTETNTESITTTTTGTSSATGSTDITDTSTANATSEETNANTSSRDYTENKQHKFSNTPQGSISSLSNYLTEASTDDLSIDESNTVNTTVNGESTNTVNSTSGTEIESASEHETSTNVTKTNTYNKKGNQGVNTYAHDMKELRETFLNVDMLVIDSLRDLFILIY